MQTVPSNNSSLQPIPADIAPNLSQNVNSQGQGNDSGLSQSQESEIPSANFNSETPPGLPAPAGAFTSPYFWLGGSLALILLAAALYWLMIKKRK